MRHGTGTGDLDRLMANNRHYWLGWGALTGPDDDLVAYRSGLAHASFNGILRLRGLPFADLVAWSRDLMAGVPSRCFVGPDSDPDVAVGLRTLGARRTDGVPIMVRSPGRPPGVPDPDGLEITEVDLDGIPEWVATYGPVFGLSPDVWPAVTRLETARNDAPDTMVRLSGVMAGRPVATAALLLRDGVAGLYAVATQLSHRRRGVATAMVAHCLDLARDRGADTVTLQSTRAGLPVYERLGFTTVAHCDLFDWPRP